MALRWTPKPEAEARRETELAGYLKALGHPIRVRILRTLMRRESCCCGDLVDALPLAQSTISQHLKVLKEAGLVDRRTEGPRQVYRVQPEGLSRLRIYVDAL